MYPIKKVIAIHDISCYGRASLTTIIPTLSIMGVQVCPLPTAILSTHTGGYGKPEQVDLSNFIDNAKNHWKELNLEFDCIYTGYLSNASQVKLIKDIIKDFKSRNKLVVIDPVMADEGKLYSNIGVDMVEALRDLILEADIITPNITEAAFLLGKDYNDIFDFEEVDIWAIKLADLGIDNVVITSVPSKKGSNYIDTISYDRKTERLIRISVEKVDKYYPGTGDFFASILIGEILSGVNIQEAAKKASEFIGLSIAESAKYDYNSKEGILLEKVLPKLLKKY